MRLCCRSRPRLSQIMSLKVILMVFLLSGVKPAVAIIRYGASFIVVFCLMLNCTGCVLFFFVSAELLQFA